ncbi:Planctomycete cytochrome C [Novipirellula galeiformis]|uniref:Planctomycete cytochrome C n=1 Tax=Novipirellula galeiformis TaxID=2528004 RepID=A0A5C6CE58_9BACT|nr:DUF1553 domain-containing protein [Novipirellula galeiformis]TWU22548.1 Planctomycete cytochrome C [Novipirellula galeiformis]
MSVVEPRRFATLTLLCAVASFAWGEDSSGSDRAVGFNLDVRPILSENCFHCHGFDEAARQADLRLDTEEGVKENAIEPGDAAQSDLYLRLISDDPDLRMPPPGSGRSLREDQIETIRKWIDQGADYEGHWSFVAPQRPEVPEPNAGQRAYNAIDHFVQAKLTKNNLSIAPEADRETLIRRVTFDLTGLPPTIEEIDSFLADDSEDAYERCVDRLLKRDAYGERMAADWLDVARYSDTYGFQVDRDRFVWPWRDWVIRALNQNMPYDQFITEQLAGDLLPGATRDQILATTFNRLHPQECEGGSVPEEFRIESVADRTQTVATGIMGLTMECCRCHDHKYDPLKQKEYFQLSAFFDNIAEAGLYSFFTNAIPTPTLPLPTPDQEQQLATTTTAVESAWQALRNAVTARQEAAAKWAAGLESLDAESNDVETQLAPPILALDFEDTPSAPNTQTEGVIGNAVKLTGDDPINTKVGNFSRFTPFSVSCWIKSPDVKSRAVIFHRSRAWTDAASRGYELLIDEGRLRWSLIHFWPGNAISIRSHEAIPTDQWIHVVVSNDGSSSAAGLAIYVDGKQVETETVRDSLTKNITGGGGDTIAIGERFRDNGFKLGSVDEFQVYDTELTKLEIQRLCAAKLPAANPTAETAQLLRDHYLGRIDDTVERARQQLKEARKNLCAVQDAVDEIMVMKELSEPKLSYLLERGVYDQRGEAVEPATPSILPNFPEDAPRNRLGLAQWLTRNDHPLTSRVAVNRLWQICFGEGIVRTPEDFGSQGAPPTHPELLDWLAVEFIENGWDIKRMLKRIVTSATYRQSSQNPDPQSMATDPENQLLSRFPSYRLPAEMIRDNALAIGQRLVTAAGGPPVKPYDIEESFSPSKRDSGNGLYRRSLYTYWKRTGPAPTMMTLDAAKRDVCQVKRERTSSPLQAFVLMNGPQFVEAGRVTAETLIQLHGDDTAAILVDAFRKTTSRKPSATQLETLQTLYQAQLDYFTQHDGRTTQFLAIGDAEIDDGINRAALAATSVVVGTLMNFDLCVMKR